MPTKSAQYQLVTNDSELSAFLTVLPDNAAMVAIDTEADSMYHYHTSLCMLQFTFGDAAGESMGTWLVDPLAGLDLSVLFERISVIPLVLFHAADYDLRLLRTFYNWRPKKIFDTMFAARVIGERQFGLAALVQTHLGVTLTKAYQRYNWSLRPLKSEVLNYAANDTIFTLRLYPVLSKALEEAGRTEWHEQFCRREVDDAWVDELTPVRDEERCWRVKGWQTVTSPIGLAVLRAAWHWREELAERTDRPPFKVMGNEMLIRIAHWAMLPLSERPAEFDVPRNIQGRSYRALCDAVKAALALAPNLRPSRYIRKTLPMLPDIADQMGYMRRQRDVMAEELGIDPGFAIPNSTLESLIRANPVSIEELAQCPGVMPWQTQMLGARLLKDLVAATALLP